METKRTLNLFTELTGADMPPDMDHSNFVEHCISILMDKSPAGAIADRHAKVMRCRFINQLTLRQTAELIGVRPERIRQNQAKAIRILKHPTRRYLWDSDSPAPIPTAPRQWIPTGIEMTILRRTVETLDLSARSATCLRNLNIQTILDLVQKTESDLLGQINFGRKSLREVKDRLSDIAMSLDMKPVIHG